MTIPTDLPGAEMTVIDYAMAKAEGRRAKEAVLEALVECDIPTDTSRRVLAKLREVGVL